MGFDERFSGRGKPFAEGSFDYFLVRSFCALYVFYDLSLSRSSRILRGLAGGAREVNLAWLKFSH